MQITNNTARLFRHWMEVIGLGHIYDDPRFKGAPSAISSLEAKVELARLILDKMAARTFDEWLGIFVREGLPGGHFLTTQQALDHQTGASPTTLWRCHQSPSSGGGVVGWLASHQLPS